MAKLNGISIADPAKSNDNFKNNQHFEVTLREKGPLGTAPTDQEKLLHFPKLFPTVFGFDSESYDTVPITNAVETQIDDSQDAQERSTKADVETFEEVSELSNSAAKAYVKKNHYKTIITALNPWRDSATGKVYLFEGYKQATRLA
jgi:hypothetical protein